MIETGWLIERTDLARPYWFVVRIDGELSWFGNANEAIRFCRKIDAERLLTYPFFVGAPVIVTEHSWEPL